MLRPCSFHPLQGLRAHAPRLDPPPTCTPPSACFLLPAPNCTADPEPAHTPYLYLSTCPASLLRPHCSLLGTLVPLNNRLQTCANLQDAPSPLPRHDRCHPGSNYRSDRFAAPAPPCLSASSRLRSSDASQRSHFVTLSRPRCLAGLTASDNLAMGHACLKRPSFRPPCSTAPHTRAPRRRRCLVYRAPCLIRHCIIT